MFCHSQESGLWVYFQSMKTKPLPSDFLKDFTTYVSFKSISTDTSFAGDITKTVDWLVQYLKDKGATTKVLKSGTTNPVVFGSFVVNKNAPTVLVYGHYDVQPAEVSDGWSTKNPFTIEERKGRLLGRGVVDNKGQNLIHLYTVAKLFKEGNLAYNVKFLLEGNEESGNPDLPNILKKEAVLLACDYVLVSDGEIVGDSPVIESALRGGGNIRVTYKTGTNNLHSGIFGGAVPSAPLELSRVLASLKDVKTNAVSIKGFYDGVPMPSKKLRANNEKITTTKEATKLAGVKTLLTQKNFDFYTQTGMYPTLEISGIKTGYIGEGFANIVPAEAEVRINVRTVSPQKTAKVLRLVEQYMKKSAPSYVAVSTFIDDHGDPIALDYDSPFAESLVPMLRACYGHDVLYKFVGGSIPILGDFQKILKTRVVSVSLGNNDCNMHGVDENYRIDLIEKGLRFSNEMFAVKNS